jgi:hypothetical protein
VLSVSVVAQYALPSSTQSVCPLLHDDAHLPFTQSEPSPQKFPHEPQFAGSMESSKHEFPHCVVPPPHVVLHWPCVQSIPSPHAVPHVPQFRLSRERSLHTPWHMTWFGEQ